MKKILIYGAGAHCYYVINLIEKLKKYKIVGIIGKKKEIKKKILNYKVNYTDEDLEKLKKKTKLIIVSFTGYSNLEKRYKVIQKLSKNFIFPNIISPGAVISKYSKIGVGNQIFDNVVINAGSIIQNHCIINSMSLIEHNVSLNNNCHISTGCLINGNCNIGNHTFIGSGSTLRQNIKIKKNQFIKMGSIIKK